MLVSTLETLLVCSPIRKADARSGVKPHILTKSTSAASRFRAVIGHSFPPPTPAMKTIRTVPTGRKASERRACLLPDSLTDSHREWDRSVGPCHTSLGLREFSLCACLDTLCCFYKGLFIFF